MPKHPLHSVAIVGAHNTRQARQLEGETSMSIALEAVRGALADAGVQHSQVDGAVVRGGMAQLDPRRFIHLIGGRPAWAGNAGWGTLAVLEAAAAIAAGYCETVVVAFGQAGMYTERESTAPWTRPSTEFVECWGLFTAAEFALMARRHMHNYGTKPEHLAEVAATIRNNGHINPEAVMYGRGPYTAQDVLESRMIADPFHLLDCSITTEGGAAMVLTTAERARDLPVQPVYLLGGAVEAQGKEYVMAPVWDRIGWVGRWAAQKSFAMAGCRPEDIDVCEFYCPFSFEVIRQFEAFGFCGEGEGGPFVMDGRIGIDGQYPVGTDGGLLAFSHAGTVPHLQRVIASVQQLRGQCGDRQAPDARIAMATYSGSAALGAEVLILGKEQASG